MQVACLSLGVGRYVYTLQLRPQKVDNIYNLKYIILCLTIGKPILAYWSIGCQLSIYQLQNTDRIILKSVEEEFWIELGHDDDLSSGNKSTEHDHHFAVDMKEW